MPSFMRHQGGTTKRRLGMAGNRAFLYVKAPDGMPSSDCFRLVDVPMPVPRDGHVLVETHYLSIDPYMRRMMGNGHGQYAQPLRIGDVMVGRGVGVVLDSR